MTDTLDDLVTAITATAAELAKARDTLTATTARHHDGRAHDADLDAAKAAHDDAEMAHRWAVQEACDGIAYLRHLDRPWEDAWRRLCDLDLERPYSGMIVSAGADPTPSWLADLGAWDDAPGDGANPLDQFLIDWPEFWATDHAETEWLLEPLFALGRAHAIYAGAKTGKSYLTLAACAALATGRPFLHHVGGDPVHVLYVDYEMTAEDLKDRLIEFGYGPDDDLSHLHYALLPSMPPLNTAAGGIALCAAADACGAQLVIIDTTGRATDGEENDADVIRDYYRHTGLPLKRRGITVARLDHAGKDAARGQRGSSAKNDDVDVVWKMTRRDAGQALEATHRRMSWVPEKVEVDIATSDGLTTFQMAGGGTWPPGTRDLALQLEALGLAPDLGTRKVREAMKAAGITAASDVMRAAVRYRKTAPEMLVVDPEKRAEMSAARSVDDEARRAPRRATENPHEIRAARSAARSARTSESNGGAPPHIGAARPPDRAAEPVDNSPPADPFAWLDGDPDLEEPEP